MTRFELADALRQANFDVEAYSALYPDLLVLGDDLSLIAEHFVAYGLAEARALVFRSIEGFLAFLRVLAEQDESARRRIGRCVLSGWNIWQSQERATDQNNWKHYSDLGDAFRLCGFRVVCVVGDSHSWVFTGAAMREYDIACLWVLCGGGSARGLINPRSTSGYGKAIQETLDTGSHPTIFHFGQVDVEFVYYYQVAVLQDGRVNLDSLRTFIIESCDRYIDFMSSTPQLNKSISAIFPPCLRDDYIHQGSANAHIAFLNSDVELDDLREKLSRVIFPDIRARTAMHYLMNLELARRASEAGIAFVNAWFDMVDERGLITDRLNFSGGYDHHIGIEPTADVLAPHVLDFLLRSDRIDSSASQSD